MVRVSFARLLAALVRFVAAVVLFAAALVRLAATGVGVLTTRLAKAGGPRAPTVAARGPLPANVRQLSDARRPRALPRNERADAQPGAQGARLTAALTGLGFAAPAVRAFVASLGGRVEAEPLEGLIREGLRAFAA